MSEKETESRNGKDQQKMPYQHEIPGASCLDNCHTQPGSRIFFYSILLVLSHWGTCEKAKACKYRES